MSDSDTDDEFKEIFDAFDQVKEEDHQDAEACATNLQIHGQKFDPYAPKTTLKEDDRKIIDSLKNPTKTIAKVKSPSSDTKSRKRPAEPACLESPAKIARPASGKKRVFNMGQIKDKTLSGQSEASSTSAQLKNCKLSGLRFRSFEKDVNPSFIEFKVNTEGAKFVHLNSVASGLKTPDCDWATIGIVVKKITPATVDKKGNKFTIFSLSNLRDIPAVIKVMAFNQIHTEHWKTQIGAAVLLLNPKPMGGKNQNSSYGNEPTFTMASPDKFVVLGFSSDLGTCSSNTKAGTRCQQFINLQNGQLCPTHVMQQMNRASSQRGVFSTSNASRTMPGSAWDKTKKDFFFAGGKTFQALPPSINPACSTNGGKLAAAANMHAAAFVKDMKKNPGIVVNEGARPVGKEDTGKMTQSYRHGGRLLAAALGKHEQNESLLQSRKLKTGSKNMVSISATDLLKQKNEEFLVHKRELIKKKKLEAAMNQEAKMKNDPFYKQDKLIISGGPPKSLFQKLGGNTGGSNSNQKAKLKAALLLQNPGSPKSKKDKILERVDSNLKTKKERKEIEENKKTSFMGKTMKNVDAKAIFAKKSHYHDSVENLVSAQKDFYYSILEKKEEMQCRMDNVMQTETKAVTCKQCQYTYWSAHEMCKKKNHDLVWTKVQKKWFQCMNCPSQRAITMDSYPRNTCGSCGSSTRWKRCAANDVKAKNITEASNLLIRGEERKWVNS